MSNYVLEKSRFIRASKKTNATQIINIYPGLIALNIIFVMLTFSAILYTNPGAVQLLISVCNKQKLDVQ